MEMALMTGMESEKSKLNEYGNKSLDLSFAYPEGWGVAETKNCHKYFKSDFENDCVDIVKDGYSVRIVLVALIGDEGHGYYDEYHLQSSKVLWVNGRKVFRSKYLNMTGGLNILLESVFYLLPGILMSSLWNIIRRLKSQREEVL